MLSMMLRCAPSVVLAVAIAVRAGASEPFVADCRALTQDAHRLTGTDELRRAADHVEKRLREIGIPKIFVQEFSTARTTTKRCEMLLDSGARRVALFPMRPDGIMPPVSPSGGLTGKLLHAGLGEPRDFTERPQGRIVVLDYRSHEGWLYAFRLGAKAVVFTASDAAEAWQRHSIEADANLPRYFYNGPASDLPDGAEATIHSEIVWEPAPGRNVFALIEGSDPILQEEMGTEVMILATNLDSYGEVPSLSRGARGAVNCAALLKIAEHLKNNRPRRNVLVAFFDGQASCHTGSTAFYRALENESGWPVFISRRRTSLRNEQAFVAQLSAVLQGGASGLKTEAGSSVMTRIFLEEPEYFAMVLLAIAAVIGILWQAGGDRRLLLVGLITIVLAVVLMAVGTLVHTDSEVRAAGDVAKSQAERLKNALAAGTADQIVEPSGRLVRHTVEYPWMLTFVVAVVASTLMTRWLVKRGALVGVAAFASTAVVVLLPIVAALVETKAERSGIYQVTESAGAQIRRRLVASLKEKAEEHVDLINETQQQLRTAGTLDAKVRTRVDTPAEAEARKQVEALTDKKIRWNNLRRNLANENIVEEIVPELEQALAEVSRDVAIRSAELDFVQRVLDSDEALRGALSKDLEHVHWIGLHVSLVLGDNTTRWGLVIGGDSPLRSDKDLPGLYGKIQRSFLNAHESLRNGPNFPEDFETASADGSLSSTRVLFGAPYLVHSGEVAGRMGMYNLVLGTSQDSLRREGTPNDTLDRLELAAFEKQADEIATVFHKVSFEDGLSLRRSIVPDKSYYTPEFDSDYRVLGPRVMAKTRGSSVPNKPLRGVVVRLNVSRTTGRTYEPRKPYAFEPFLVCMTDQNGSYEFGPIAHDPYMGRARGFGAKFDERGEVVYASSNDTAGRVNYRLNMFNCYRGVVVLPPVFEPRDVAVLGAKGNFRLEDEKSFFQTYDGVVYWYCEDKIKSVKLFQQETIIALTSGELAEGETIDDQFGRGLQLDDGWALPSTARLAASDIWQLNEARMLVLQSRGMMDSSIQELHGRAHDLLKDASRTANVAEASAMEASAFLAEVPVYRNTRYTLDDLVHAVLVLLALSVPFAFALERLLIGATSIYRQIAYFGGFFIITFLILFFSHPAFAVSKTPMIIFLGFAILILSTLVIVVVMRRFEYELKTLQGLTTTVHTADVSRFNTMMAAMAMGISTMRRRPLRTALTATTIVLLTFTILCFASFGKKTGVVKLFLMPPPGHTGVMTRDVNWRPLGSGVLEILRGRWGSSTTVSPRYWVSPERETDAGFLITRTDGTNPVPMRGVLGLEHGEFAHRPDMATIFGEIERDIDELVWLTDPVARSLKVVVGDEVVVAGLRRRVGGILDSGSISEVADMDGSSILPVDFVEMTSSTKAVKEVDDSGLALASRENWAALPTDSVIIAGARTALQMGASLRAVMIYSDDATEAAKIAEDIARILPLPIAATRGDGVYRHFLGSIIQAGGAKDLLFPVLLGGLVIFGTMLGSVADREREIFTFSALGLAPPHVASLFFAETLVYSVVGGLGGYLLAQASMKMLEYLADFGLVSVPEMNYSSTNAIVTLLIVMGTVIASSVYPALRASRSANPGILRSWRLPAPEGDDLNIVFPFTVSEYDITGVVSFLKEHFDNLADAGLGVFMSRDARLVRGGDTGPKVGLKAVLALAPFDLGVTQDFGLTSAPSEIPGIDLVKITIRRLSGQPKDWARLNKVLLDDLRKQFLIWRSLPRETMEIYRHRTLETMGALSAE